ncbi:MAG: putative immunity protein [Candidatus Geothermincolia bacterium]
MKKPKFPARRSLEVFRAEGAFELAGATNHRELGVWASECAVRVLHYFEEQCPDDHRPRQALEALQAWIDTGAFSMKTIRGASLDAHSAAKEMGNDSAAASAAHAAGQAVGTAHAPMHCLGAANYSLQAVYRAVPDLNEAETAVASMREWQLDTLRNLKENGGDTNPSSDSLWRDGGYRNR